MAPSILVVDDNPKIKDSLVEAFPEYDFVSALTGEDGLKRLKGPHEFDLILLDYKLGAMDGIAVLKEIRRMDGSIGVMVLTSFGTKEVVLEALRNHADDFIDKPFSVSDLKEKLEIYFEKRVREEGYSPRGAPPMQRILKFVERNYRKNVTLEAAAERALLSPKYLSRKFKSEMRMTFSDYRIKLRMDQARKLLRRTSLGIAQIAYKVGYENAESFMKAFKKSAGCTPTQFRRKK